MTPKETMKEYCRQCLNTKQYRTELVKNCQGDTAACGPCPFYPYRMKRVSVKVFRKNCLYCMGGSRSSIDECSVEDCPCFPYKEGRSLATGRKGNLSALQKYRETVAATRNNL